MPKPACPFFILLLTVAAAVIIVSCRHTEHEFTDELIMDYAVYYHREGIRTEVEPEKADLVQAAVMECLDHVKDRPRLYIDTERVDEVLAEEAWELIYEQAVDFNVEVGSYGRQSAQRIIVPLSGYFADPEGGNEVTVFTQADMAVDAWDIWLCSVSCPSVWQDMQP